MWKYLTEKMIQRQSARSRKTRSMRFIPYAEAETIVVLADPQSAQQVEHSLRALKTDGKNVVLYHFTMALQQTRISFPGIDTVEISLQDLMWGNNRPRPEVCRRFDEWHADVLIDLTTTELFPAAYLISRSRAPLRLGLKKETIVPADMMMQECEDTATADGLLRNLLFYWKNIAAKNNNL